MLPAPSATSRTITWACTSYEGFCAQNAKFTQIMCGLTCRHCGTRNVTTTKHNFQNYYRSLYIKCGFLCTKLEIHSDHARINLQPSQNPGCYQHHTQFLELSLGRIFRNGFTENFSFILLPVPPLYSIPK